MEQIKINFKNDNELADFEAESRGYRLDVYVTINNYIYNVCIYSMTRLLQDFETEYETYGYYLTEANMILVKDTNRLEIINTIEILYERGFFKNLKPIDYKEE